MMDRLVDLLMESECSRIASILHQRANFLSDRGFVECFEFTPIPRGMLLDAIDQLGIRIEGRGMGKPVGKEETVG